MGLPAAIQLNRTCLLNLFVRSRLFFAFLVCLSLTPVLMAAPLDPGKLRQLDVAIDSAIADGKLPGAVVWIEHGTNVYWKAYGERSLVPTEETMTRDTIFDLASLTKVIATAPAIMMLVERGQVKLDETAHTYIPEFTGGGKEKITIRQLLTHTSGLTEDVSSHTKWHGTETAIQMASATKLRAPPGTEFRYSDINFFLLGEIVHRVSGMPLNEFCAKEIYGPLKMIDTRFLPPESEIPRIAPTQMTDGVMLRGVVHDPTSRYMGGVAGHAGLFSTAPDLARFARMMLNMGELDGVRIMKPETVKMMTSVQTPPDMDHRRGFGWDIDTGFSSPRGEHFPLGSYGHTGFTGNSFWIDPYSKTFVIFLSNRVHPYGQGSVVRLYRTVGTLAAEAVTDFDFAYVPDALAPFPRRPQHRAASEEAAYTPKVLNGIDVLVNENFAPLKGLRIGLITNPTGKDCHRYPTIDLLRNAPGVELKMLFSPEHGLYGTYDEPVSDSFDEHTGLPIFSLYGIRHAPSPEQLAQLDALVFDIQDVGCRFYTYTATLGLTMEAANKAGVKFFVLDRVNPINGVAIDGPMLTGKTSFVAFHPEPVRYGMTEGELAQMYKAERHLDNLDLTVIPLKGWDRKSWFDETGQPWINPSPNMRSLTEATLYPGVGLLEYCQISVGRGTGTPFEVIGAPYVEDEKFAEAMNREGLPGVRFVPVRFTPTDNKFKNESCGGVNIILTDREKCQVVDIGVVAAKILNQWYPDQFEVTNMSRLLGNEEALEGIENDAPLSEIRAKWSKDVDAFKERRAKYLLYP
ncbi:MAG TPA: exo-beta-N-acetylmuramidase NamZ domain-containing protein [Verrucomicrobiae bacterium]|nr:exo-beta-N-acetylmuramidase NamZ domain-containing protein [Verrucomicrobiae bacterium]